MNSLECATRYPFILVHGTGFRDRKGIGYWGRIPKALEARGAAVVIPDAESRTEAMKRATELLKDPAGLAAMSRNLESLAKPHAAEDIVNELVNVME